MIMIMLSFHHFWGEIVEGAAKSCSLDIWFHEIGPSKIGKFESAVAVNKKILRLYVSMNYTLAMQVFERIYKVFDVLFREGELKCKYFCLLLCVYLSCLIAKMLNSSRAISVYMYDLIRDNR